MSPRSWNRREFDVRPAGYFTVLKPSGSFSALQLPGGFRYLSRGAAVPQLLQKPAGLPSSADFGGSDGNSNAEALMKNAVLALRTRTRFQFLLIASIAAAATFTLLWYISGGH